MSLIRSLVHVGLAGADDGGVDGRREVAQGFSEQGQADQEVVVALGGVDVHSHEVGRGQEVASSLELVPTGFVEARGHAGLRRQLETTIVNQVQELLGQACFRGLAKM